MFEEGIGVLIRIAAVACALFAVGVWMMLMIYPWKKIVRRPPAGKGCVRAAGDQEVVCWEYWEPAKRKGPPAWRGPIKRSAKRGYDGIWDPPV